jgi:hypothetical protein
MKPVGLSAEARARVVALGREERASWGERALAGFMGVSVAAGVFVAVGLTGEFWPSRGAATGGAVVAERRVEEREMFERRLVRGESWDWRTEVPYGDR